MQSVDRAITILEILARVGEAGVTEIAGELGVHKSTAFRLVGTMQARGLVEQTDDRGKYRIGLSLVRMAGTSAARTDLVRVARPMCKQLATETGETINLAVLVDSMALYLDQIAGASALQPHNWVGQRIPLHATSNGKALLAHLDPREVDRLVPHLEPHTARTVTRRTTLHRELAGVRERGYALAVDELEEGLTALAAPIRDAHGDVVASLSVSGSTHRMDAATLEATVEPLLRAAREVSLAMGWAGPAPD
ncbi:IclR family transcriptional regulator [Nocardioides euryhalodurans]|uniref:Glycerol operon regulatory protein n=1 Tax=Nocardioides euryhalodurans TaxID=2518370 RepID=A0A4P7GQ33_9ACTN|nr:IclR family transcriptional regulator [Nocardioides euryhalodurans]